MSEYAELKARLRDEHVAASRTEAADAIEALTTENARCWRAVEAIGAKADALETKLAAAEAGLRDIAAECGCSIARATLATIKGDKT